MWGVSKEIQDESDARAEAAVVGHNRGVIQRTYRKLEDIFAALPPDRTITNGQLAIMFGTVAKNLENDSQ